MTDPVAEAAAQIAAQTAQATPAEPTIIERIVEGMHDLEAKVEHLIHPDAPGNASAVAEASATAPATAKPVAEVPNVDASTAPAGAAMPASTGGELPNAASAADTPTAAPASAPNADGENTTSPTAASSASEPLHVRIAAHLEAIYNIAKNHVEAAPAAAVADTSPLKTHIGDILHRISNGMAVSEGEVVTKLEALYRML